MLSTGSPQINLLIALGLLLAFFAIVATIIIRKLFPSPEQMKRAVEQAMRESKV